MEEVKSTFSLGYTNRYRSSLFLPRPWAFTEPSHSVIEHILGGLAHTVPPLPSDGEIRFTARTDGRIILTFRHDDHAEFIEDMEYLVIHGALDMRLIMGVIDNYPYDVGISQLKDRMPATALIDCLTDPERVRVIPFGHPDDGMFACFQEEAGTKYIAISGIPVHVPMHDWGNEQLQQRFWQKLTTSFGQAQSADA